MSKLYTLFLFLSIAPAVIAQNVAINNNSLSPHESAMLHVQSNSKGLLVPRMNTAQRTSITDPANGLLVYDVTTESFWHYANSGWEALLNDERLQDLYLDGDTLKISHSTSAVKLGNLSHWDKSGIDIHRMSGNVGIGTSSPLAQLHVADAMQITGTFGSGDSLLSPGNVPRLLFYPRKAAFRAGGAFADQWDEPNIGEYSTATGFSTSATGDFGVSMGYYNEADGDYSVALGRTSHAETDYSIAIGHSVWTYSPYEIAVGRWNTTYTPQSTILWNEDDRLFVVGNGTDNANRSDAMTILKNGNVGIGTSTPTSSLDLLGIMNIQGSNNDDAVIWDDGKTALVNSSDLLRTDRQWVNLLVDADNSQSNAHFAIFNDDSTSSASPVVNFNLDSGDSWINSGNVGIGTTAPLALLHVAGDAKIDGATFNVDAVNNRVGIGTTTPDTRLHVAGGMKVDGATFNVDATNNWVGIGTTTPFRRSRDIRHGRHGSFDLGRWQCCAHPWAGPDPDQARFYQYPA